MRGPRRLSVFDAAIAESAHLVNRPASSDFDDEWSESDHDGDAATRDAPSRRIRNPLPSNVIISVDLLPLPDIK